MSPKTTAHFQSCWRLTRQPSGTLVPFLYQTRTVTSTFAGPKKPWPRQSYLNCISPRRNAYKNAFLQILEGSTRERLSLRPSLPPAESTLTGSERAVFDRIYKSLLDTKNTNSLHALTSDEELDLELGSLPSNVSLETIFKDATSTREDRVKKPKDETQLFVEQDVNLLQAPLPSMRRDALLIQKLDSESDTSSVVIRHSRKRLPRQGSSIKQARIQNAMSRFDSRFSLVETDVEVWHVLESEAFAKMRALTAHLDAEVQKETLSNAEQLTQSNPSSDLDLLLPLLQAVYGPCLLKAQRFLRINFPHSPYTLALLPAIKALGPISYVLGTSTELYNELLFVRWKHYRDLHGCADLLAEMLSRGILIDGRTMAVWRDADRTRTEEKSKSEERETMPNGDAEAVNKTWRDGTVNPLGGMWWLLQGSQSAWNSWSELRKESLMRWKEEIERRQKVMEPVDSHENEETVTEDCEASSSKLKTVRLVADA